MRLRKTSWRIGSKPARLVYDFRFVAENSEQLAIPEEPPVLRFFMREARVQGPGIDSCPEDLINEVYEKAMRDAVCKPKEYEIPLPPGTVFIHPNSQTQTMVKAFAFTYRVIPKAELLDPGAHFEDHYGVTEASVREQLAKRNPAADPSRIGLGFDTVLRPTRYYYNPQLQFSYYCEEVTKGQAKIVLVESYQNGHLMQARFTISRPQYVQFVEVTQSTEIERLTNLYDTFSVSDKNLEARFKVFLRDLEGAESIDDLALTREQEEAQKADYFFADRTIIGELKALYEDTAAKMGAILKPYRNTPEWPIFFGEQELEKILQHLPDRDRIRATIFRSITRSIEAVVEKANCQIRESKRTFDLATAGGLLIILNDAVDILSPDVVAYRVRRALNKRTAEGLLRYPHVSSVIIVGGAHYTQLNSNLKSPRSRGVSGAAKLVVALLNPKRPDVQKCSHWSMRKRAELWREAADAVRLLRNTGGRLNEVLRLKWTQVNFAKKTIKLYASKTELERDVPLTKAMSELLKARQREGLASAEYVFARATTREFDKQVSRACRQAAKQVGINYGRFAGDGFTLHSLRHTYITHLLASGVDAPTVMELSGHKSYQSFSVYLTRPILARSVPA